MANNDNSSYGIRARNLERDRALAEALMQRGMTPTGGQTVGGHYVYSPMNAIAQVAQAYAGKKASEEADAGQTALSKERNDALMEAIKHYQLNPDKGQAASNAVASEFPELQKLGQAYFEAQEKGAITPSDAFKVASPQGQQEMLAKGMSGFSPKRNIEFVDGLPVDKDTVQTGQQYQPLQGRGGSLMQQNPVTGKLDMVDKAPKISVSPVVNVSTKGDSKFAEILGSKTAEAVSAAQEGGKRGQEFLRMADRLETLNRQGVMTGPTADIAMAASALTSALNAPGVRDKLARSEQFKAIVGEQAAAALTGPGGAKFTDKDMELFLSQFPQLTNSPEGINYVIGTMRQNGKALIDYSNTVRDRLRTTYPELGRMADVMPSGVPFPVEPDKPADAAPMSLEEYLKAQGAM